MISKSNIINTKEIDAIIAGICGNNNLRDAVMAPISAPIFIIFAIRRRLIIG